MNKSELSVLSSNILVYLQIQSQSWPRSMPWEAWILSLEESDRTTESSSSVPPCFHIQAVKGNDKSKAALQRGLSLPSLRQWLFGCQGQCTAVSLCGSPSYSHFSCAPVQVFFWLQFPWGCAWSAMEHILFFWPCCSFLSPFGLWLSLCAPLSLCTLSQICCHLGCGAQPCPSLEQSGTGCVRHRIAPVWPHREPCSPTASTWMLAPYTAYWSWLTSIRAFISFYSKVNRGCNCYIICLSSTRVASKYKH